MLNINILNSGNVSGADGSNNGGRYLGQWNASTNTPTLPNPPTAPTYLAGDYYQVSVAGTQFSISFDVGDEIIATTSGSALIWTKKQTGQGTQWGEISGTLSAQTDLQSALDAKQNTIAYTPENVANKATGFGTVNDTLYPSVQAVKTQLDTKFNSSGGIISGATIITNSLQASGFADTNYTAGKFLTANSSRTIVSALEGGVLTADTLVAGSGYVAGTYTAVPLTGGDGTGAQATIVVAIGGNILTTNNLVAGSGYVAGSYSAVPLTGGDGTSATADIEVDGGGQVTSVDILNPGINYGVGNTLSASNANLGGAGSGFSVDVATINPLGYVSNVTISKSGSGYTVDNTLSASNTNLGGSGSGFSIDVATIFYEPVIKESGAVIQTVSASTGSLITISTTPLPVDDTIPVISEGEEIITRTITCESASNKLLITATTTVSTATLKTNGLAVFQSGVTDALGAVAVTTNSNDIHTVSFTILTGAVNTTDEVTISLRGGNSDNSALYINGAAGARFFGGVNITSLTVSEIKA